MVSERLALFFLAVKLFGLLEVVDCYSSERIAFFAIGDASVLRMVGPGVFCPFPKAPKGVMDFLGEALGFEG